MEVYRAPYVCHCGRGFDSPRGLAVHATTHRCAIQQCEPEPVRTSRRKLLYEGEQPAVYSVNIHNNSSPVYVNFAGSIHASTSVQQTPTPTQTTTHPPCNKPQPGPTFRPPSPDITDFFEARDEIPEVNYPKIGLENHEQLHIPLHVPEDERCESVEQIRDPLYKDGLNTRNLSQQLKRGSAVFTALASVPECALANDKGFILYFIYAFRKGVVMPKKFSVFHRFCEASLLYIGCGRPSRPFDFIGNLLHDAGMMALYGQIPSKRFALGRPHDGVQLVLVPVVTGIGKDHALCLEASAIGYRHLKFLANKIQGHNPFPHLVDASAEQKLHAYLSAKAFVHLLQGRVMQIELFSTVFRPPAFEDVEEEEKFLSAVRKYEQKSERYKI